MAELLKISSEDELLAHLMEKHELGQFAKVTRISTLRVSPEIDLLYVAKKEKKVIGYEIKLLRYNRRWKRANFYPFYTGIGQSLLYLQHGVDRSYLVVGLAPNLLGNSFASTVAKIEETANLFRTLRNVPTKYRYPYGQERFVSLYGFDCFGIMLWTPRNDILETKLKAERDCLALSYDEDLRHKHTCFLKRQFMYDKDFLDKRPLF